MRLPTIRDYSCATPVNEDYVLLSPGLAVICAGGTLQLSPYLAALTSEAALISGVTFASSNTAVATVDISGLVTAVAAGVAIISATNNGLTGYAKIVVRAGVSCCAGYTVGTYLVIDRSLTMQNRLDPYRPTLLFTAKEIASAVAAAMNAVKDQMGLITFDCAPDLRIGLGVDISALQNAITNVSLQSTNDDYTDVFAALQFAIAQVTLDGGALSQRVIILITDGISSPELSSTDAAAVIELAKSFRSTGGVICTVGLNVSGTAYTMLRDLSTPGYFLNVTNSVATVQSSLLNLVQNYCGGPPPT